MQERRRFVRLDARLPVVYQVVPSSSSTPAVTKDIGGGGVCVVVREPLARGTRLHVEITMPGQEQAVTFTGEVVWCEQHELIGKTQRERSAEAGVRFLQIDPRDQHAIMRYVIGSMKPHQGA